jgi:hypothetical protein
MLATVREYEYHCMYVRMVAAVAWAAALLVNTCSDGGGTAPSAPRSNGPGEGRTRGAHSAWSYALEEVSERVAVQPRFRHSLSTRRKFAPPFNASRPSHGGVYYASVGNVVPSAGK